MLFSLVSTNKFSSERSPVWCGPNSLCCCSSNWHFPRCLSAAAAAAAVLLYQPALSSPSLCGTHSSRSHRHDIYRTDRTVLTSFLCVLSGYTKIHKSSIYLKMQMIIQHELHQPIQHHQQTWLRLRACNKSPLAWLKLEVRGKKLIIDLEANIWCLKLGSQTWCPPPVGRQSLKTLKLRCWVHFQI